MTMTTTIERAAADAGAWTEVCALDALTPDRGVAALVDGRAVALFRLAGEAGVDDVVAVDHVDPFHGIGVLARGLVGSAAGRPFVASPLHKQRFDLRTGECLDDPAVAVERFPVSVVDGVVHVGCP